MPSIQLDVPDTLLDQLETNARREGVSLEQHIVFALTRQTMLNPVIRRVSKEDADCQGKDFYERIKRLGKACPEEFEKVLRERDVVEPEPGLSSEAISRLKERMAEAEMARDI